MLFSTAPFYLKSGRALIDLQ